MMSKNTMQNTEVKSNIITVTFIISTAFKPFIVYFKHSFLLVKSLHMLYHLSYII